MAGKGDLKAAAAHLAGGLAKLGAGDLPGALTEFEKALELYGPVRGPAFADWVRWVQSKAKDAGAPLDEDALKAMSEALEEPKSGKRPRPPQVLHEPEPTRPERSRKLTPPPLPGMPRTSPPTPIETAATMTLPQPPAATPKVTRDPEERESPWDPVPLTPGGSEAPQGLRDQKQRRDQMAELQSQATKAAPPPIKPGSSATILGMPALEPKLLTPQNRKRNKVTEDRPESVTREFKSATPTGPNLRPLDVPELTTSRSMASCRSTRRFCPRGAPRRSSSSIASRWTPRRRRKRSA